MALSPDSVARMAADYTAAWNSGSADAVAAFYAKDGQIVINRGEPWGNRAGVRDMAAGFFADVPDLSLRCDDIRVSGNHAVYVWSFTGHDATTGHPLHIKGWEEWDLTDDLLVASSRGWFDAEDYGRQAAGA